jgi:dihydrolipoamide dehydrogenase
MGQNRGMIRVYADRKNRKILGAAMVGARAEHLAHLISWAIEVGMTVDRALEMPFYHPVIEEALQEVLHDLQKELSSENKIRYVFFHRSEEQSTLGA